MINYLAALFFIGMAFITGLSIAFNICALLGREEEFFKTKKNAIVVYVIAIVFSIIFTAINYSIVRMIQNIF